MPFNRQSSFEFPVEGASFQAPAVRVAHRRRRVMPDAEGHPPFQLALEAQGEPIEVRLPVPIPVPVPVCEPVRGADDALPAVGRRERQGPGTKLQKAVSVHVRGRVWEVCLRLVPDEYEPHGVLMAFDELGDCVAEEKVVPDFRLTEGVARGWIEGDFE